MNAKSKLDEIVIIPAPLSLERREGSFDLDTATVLVADETTRLTASALADAIRPALGMQPEIATAAPAGARSILFSLDSSLSDLGPEGYRLEVAPERITLAAPAQAGLFYAVQTLRQLLPTDIFSGYWVDLDKWPVPCVLITDRPRFGWRGLLLDTGHDFQRLSYILRFIDLMAAHKFNVLHWHICDFGTFPLEIRGYPELQHPTNLGTRMRGTPPKPVKSGTYTQNEARAVVAYAAARHITVVPEIDTPGHSSRVLNAYPQFDCPVPNWGGVGPSAEYCLASEPAMKFLKTMFSQLMDIFPSPFIHIGGDECSAGHWQKCPLCQAKVKEEGLRDVEELRQRFLWSIEGHLNQHGRRMIGWDEVFENGVKPSTAVMAWRPNRSLAAPAAAAGHDVVMALHSHLYFDFSEATTPLEKVYSFEPVPADFTPEQAARVLGAQAQLWSDDHPTEAEIDRLTYPRACAASEVFWSPAESRSWDRFALGIRTHAERLAKLGIKIPTQ